MNAPGFFWLALKASLFSVTGTGNLPLLHDDLVPRGWASERQFAESLAVGQVAPGPSGLWVISLGYFLGGLPGALAALAAICLPPLLVLVLDKLYRRVEGHPAIEGFVRALSLAGAGVFAAVLFGLLGGGDGGGGFDVRHGVVVAGSLALAATRRVPVIAILVLAGVAGTVFPR